MCPSGTGYNYFLARDTAERIIFAVVAGSGSGKLCWHSRGNDNDQENAGYVRESAGGSEQALRLRARDGAFRALARVTFFFCKKKVTKENHSNLRFKDPLARGGQVQIWRCVLAGGVRRLSLSVKRTVPAFTGAEADAAACPSHGRCFSLLPPSPKAFPLDGSAVLNDTPVACQTRGPTDPQGDRCPHIPAALAATYPLRCFAPQWARFDNRHSTSAPTPTLAVVSGSGASGTSDP